MQKNARVPYRQIHIDRMHSDYTPMQLTMRYPPCSAMKAMLGQHADKVETTAQKWIRKQGRMRHLGDE